MFPDLPISSGQATARIVPGRAFLADSPQTPSDRESFESFLAKLNDAELRLLRDQLRRVQARVFAAHSIRTLFAQFSRDALQELVESLD